VHDGAKVWTKKAYHELIEKVDRRTLKEDSKGEYKGNVLSDA
jgi:hypothetical protein